MTIPEQAHVAVVDLGFGDAGKGTTVDWLCATRPVAAVIRFNGGAQAGHNVVVPGLGAHTFSQFGAGTLRGVPTFLSRFMIVDPLAATSEAAHLEQLGVPDPYRMLTVDPEALISTPYHRLANRARELARGGQRHGSCGMGVGETVAYALDHPADAIRFADLPHPAVLRRKLRHLDEYLRAEVGPLAEQPVDDLIDAYRLVSQRVATGTAETALASGWCVLEGAQGVLLDEWRGFHPYTTWSTTTFDNAAGLTGGDMYRLGVLRCFTTRHGAGPLVTEDAGLTAAHPDPHNSTGPWQGPFRVGHFDAVAHRYAVEVAGGIDGLALTHLDAADGVGICRAYLDRGRRIERLEPGPLGDLAYQAELTALAHRADAVVDPAPDDWAEAVSTVVGAPVVVASHGPSAADKIRSRSSVASAMPACGPSTAARSAVTRHLQAVAVEV